MTKAQHKRFWQSPAYIHRVHVLAEILNSDGCTGVLDFYRNGCLEHDIAYRTHMDVFGFKITKEIADKRFRWYIQHHSPFGIFSPMSWWRWLAVKNFGHKAWKHK